MAKFNDSHVDPVGNKSTDFNRLSLVHPCTIHILYLIMDLNILIDLKDG